MQHFDGARLSPNSVRNAVRHALNEPVCHYLRNRSSRCSTAYIDNSLRPLARDSPCIIHVCQVCQISFPPNTVCFYSCPHGRTFCVPFISLFVRPHNILFIQSPHKFLITTFSISSCSFLTLTSHYSTQQ